MTKYRALLRKDLQGDQPDHNLTEQLLNLATASQETPFSLSENVRITRRRSSGTNVSVTTPAQSMKQHRENLKLLDFVSVKYRYHLMPELLLTQIPDSQLKIIGPYFKDPESFLTRKKYVTNVDERSYLTVFEFEINNNWVIWDYNTGYVFFTGLWKMCGNNKTDIVKLIDRFPNMSAESVKRVRGGFLKVQGTWLPYGVSKELCKKFCFNIRYCLIPLFGVDFPDSCLKPQDPSFGRLLDFVPHKRRRRASTNSSITTDSLNLVVRGSSSTIQKPRSQSDSVNRSDIKSPLLEMEEVLKASRRLHELSVSPGDPNHRDSFSYGGFTWLWRDGYDLKILGKDPNQSAIDDDVVNDNEYDYSVISSSNTTRESIPKSYDGFETLLQAAHQLFQDTTALSSDNSTTSTPSKRRMDIDLLLG